MRRLPFALLLLAWLLALPVLAGPPPAALRVYFFDVGQGDAALILSPAGRSVLIDGGPPESGRALADRVDALVEGPLDLVVLTHPHLDHLGGLPAVLRQVGARRFMDPGFDHPSEAYAELLELVGQTVGEVRVPERDPAKPGEPVRVGLGEGVSLTVLWPRRPVEPFFRGTRSDANANSLVTRLTYGTVDVLFTADAEAQTEQRLLASGAPLQAEVLKVSHHGSRHSSRARFLEKVRPEAAVISVGAGNEYGHPSRETLRRLQAVGARTWRTDVHGELRLETDGRTWTLTPERSAAPPVKSDKAPADQAAPYVAAQGSKVFHRADCPTVQRIAPKNRQRFTRREDAARGRRPAKDCNP